MIPVMQQVVGDGRDGRPVGDCMRACVASVFELSLDAVPHFAIAADGYRTALENWLQPLSLTIHHRLWSATDVPEYWPAGWWIASVESENFEGCTHAVVMRGTDTPCNLPDGGWMRVAHDPSPRPRRTPYRFVGATYFVALDPAAIARASRTVTP